VQQKKWGNGEEGVSGPVLFFRNGTAMVRSDVVLIPRLFHRGGLGNPVFPQLKAKHHFHYFGPSCGCAARTKIAKVFD